MKVERATYNDVQDIITYMEDYHRSSNLADITFNRISVSKIVDYFINSRQCYPLIARKDDGTVIGLLFGTVEPFFFNSKESYATDLFFFSNGAGPQLWKEFKRWAIECGAKRIMMGVSSGDERACQLLEVMGMEKTGGMYVLRS